ncbi:invasion associated locus B family protein [Govanella unica]|uniref:Invasion associated locus B family protein n=1 Tax=Govanella unica TaxID=2975056 RepID=A0A9X3TV85_9PROT|nr:invasion associated locus B family protein [Govania unica]MDA5192651.1 invasion associated locus B family protein [Govania unica]
MTDTAFSSPRQPFRPSILALSLLLAVTVPVAGAEAKGREFLGGFRDWDAFLDKTAKGEKSCYAITVPKETTPKNVKRGEIYVMVTQWPAAKVKNQISISAGYALKKDSNVLLTIDKTTYKLFVQDDRAWASDDKQDTEITAALKKGTTLSVKGVSARGTETTDSYSLAGFSSALNAITQACY